MPTARDIGLLRLRHVAAGTLGIALHRVTAEVDYALGVARVRVPYLAGFPMARVAPFFAAVHEQGRRIGVDEVWVEYGPERVYLVRIPINPTPDTTCNE